VIVCVHQRAFYECDVCVCVRSHASACMSDCTIDVDIDFTELTR